MKSEGLMLLEERIRVSVVYRNFRAPGRRYSRKHAGAFGSFGVSAQRIAGFSFSRWIIHLPFEEPKLKAVTFNTKGDKYLSASFDASIFDPEHSGHIELRFYLSNVAEAMSILTCMTKE